ncbi:DUF4290 domain-containing protein [Cytophaga hutchinsonii]|uniref:DUF4290 domain-containing protein n=1 Tax=Cytophaga hutchinsonii (strain ATCC 33406 / DSM 1761 / CIP 103989 / NBRC 15051 / NCIMB 9469 / D465) TaxID=269798 RepID=A0A6N4SRB7_CYTH3|nr:DUF4290 domain-containing protein [Cytophaga hutchinsonii]ABG58824.1 conserved hypothetical protein [Cytophaga hutchinsonii ATCC 33406]SFX80005.1 protein of unknown function [Cytophaga hutchinsonii ATCC 33406]
MTLIKGEPGKGIVLKEYGKNIQKIVDWILTIEDREQRTRYANTCVELMRQLNPGVRDTEEHTTKLWDHLFIMSNFKLDVDTPYPMPDIAVLGRKPERVPYNHNKLKYKHYGKNINLLIEQAILKEDGAEKEDAIIYLGRLMKRLYSTWNKENVDDEVIVEHLSELSKNNLQIDIARVKQEKLFDTIGGATADSRIPSSPSSSGGYSRAGGSSNRRSNSNGGGGYSNNNGNSTSRYQQNQNKPRRRN